MPDQWDLSRPDERHLAAGEYALGVMSADERARFEALLAVSHDVQRDLADWRERLQLFNEQLDPVTPPDSVWRAIAERTGAARWRSLALWRALAGGFAVLAMAFSLLWLAPSAPSPDEAAVYVVLDESRNPDWIISATEEGALRVRAVQPHRVGADQTGELWLVADGTPISLGLLPERGTRLLRPDAALRERLMTADLAVSVEPEGGAPEGKPSGPIIDHGRLTPVRGARLRF
ncbi:anti-sigma factor [Halomonas organivorans]|uniref:Anti-sigma-K factor RskA n=1 Tax=Halomonas organivorans TaxID=257772 RepID=A0A7W5BX81_9GAMM|nr:anti-sigma factor [Halomonas organivorans]MBB3140847.1 anti-sigma-K factor RskA [Halomonas organivorans]